MAPDDYFRIIFGLVAVIGLIGLAALIARKAGIGTMPSIGGRKRRLSISETLPLDARRRLVIVRCDDREHLIILASQSETVVGDNFDAVIAEEVENPLRQNPFAELRNAFSAVKPIGENPNRNAA